LKTARGKRSARPEPFRELAQLRLRPSEAQETLRAIRAGEVDAVVVAAKSGTQVFTLEGAEHAYRLLIESMNEGALTLTADKTILYANQCFAKMVKCPLEQVTGSSFRRFLSAEDRAALRSVLKRADKSGSKIQVLLHAGDNSRVPAHISIRPLAKNGSKSATFGMVVTDMTEARRNEEKLRILTHRLVQGQELERERVALELHDSITQMLCGVLVRSQVLADKLLMRNEPAKAEAVKLHAMIRNTVEEVERISHNLRPSVLDHLGLVAGLNDTSKEFANRTGVPVKMVCIQLSPRLPVDTELTLYRILQEALQNVEKHARARQVTVCLTKQDHIVQMTVHDDGIGFDPDRRPLRQKEKGGYGLLGMRERAISVGGAFKIKSMRRAGTQIEVRIPVASRAKAAGVVARKSNMRG
jgi:two-component system NarL family sensor kinase